MAMLGDTPPSSPAERGGRDPVRRPVDRPSPNAAAERLDRSDPSDLTVHAHIQHAVQAVRRSIPAGRTSIIFLGFHLREHGPHRIA